MAAKKESTKKQAKKRTTKKQLRKGRVIESLVIAEQIREEKDSKLTFVGIYGGNEIVLRGELPDLSENRIALQLAFWMQYQHTGYNHATLWVKDPTGAVLIESQIALKGKVATSPYHSLFITGGVLLVNMLGDYKVGLDYDGKRDWRPFCIVHRPE